MSLPVEGESGYDYQTRTNAVKISVEVVYVKKKKIVMPADYKVNVRKCVLNV